LNLSEDATSIDVYNTIRSTVAALFGSAEGRLVLTYADEEGDHCTLTEQTIDDLLLLSPTGALRLTMNLQDENSSHEANGESTLDVPMNLADTALSEDADSARRQRIRRLFEKMPIGPLCMAQAFVQGMDPAAMHGWLPMITNFIAQGHAAAARTQQTMSDLIELQRMEPAALQAFILSELRSEIERKGSNEAAEGDAPPPNPLETMLGPLLAASQAQGNAEQSPQNPLEQLIGAAMACKGVGRGNGTSNPSRQNPQNLLEHFMGAAMACKGLGKGDGTANPPAANPSDMIGQLLAGKGFGKGNGMWPEPGFETMTSDLSPAAPMSPQETCAERTVFDESVDDLLNMGLVSDRQVARELLTKHGDLSSVVSALTED